MEKTIDEVVQEKLDGDTEFQTSLTDLPDDEKNNLIETKRKELFNTEFKSLNEKAKEADKFKKDYESQKTRAEKSESELKKLKPEKKSDDDRLSTKDFYALTNAKVPEEDVDDVAEYAKFKGITVQEALKSPIVKNILTEKSESRRVANATNTRSTRPQNTTADGHSIIQDAKTKGEDALPEAGTAEAMALFKARHPNFKE